MQNTPFAHPLITKISSIAQWTDTNFTVVWVGITAIGTLGRVTGRTFDVAAITSIEHDHIVVGDLTVADSISGFYRGDHFFR